MYVIFSHQNYYFVDDFIVVFIVWLKGLLHSCCSISFNLQTKKTV